MNGSVAFPEFQYPCEKLGWTKEKRNLDVVADISGFRMTSLVSIESHSIKC